MNNPSNTKKRKAKSFTSPLVTSSMPANINTPNISSIVNISEVHQNNTGLVMKRTDLRLDKIIDEELFSLSNLPIPSFLKRLNERLQELEAAYNITKGMPIEFVVAGGAITRLIDAYVHDFSKRGLDANNPLAEEELLEEFENTYRDLLRETDIDVFVYLVPDSHNHLKEAKEMLGNFFEIKEDVKLKGDNGNNDYRNSLKICGLTKCSFEGVAVEFIFTNPIRIQSFDINNRNTFYYRGELLSTKSALSDIENKVSLITSPHTPLSSLIRSLAFEMMEGYKLSPVSLQLVKWAVKHFRVDVSDEKIKKIIEKRKLANESMKEELFNKIRKILPYDEIYSETKYVEDNEALIKVMNFGSRKTEPNIKRKTHTLFFVKQDIERGYEFPFHPDLVDVFSKNYNPVHEQGIQSIFELYWSKSFYDKISNYGKDTIPKIDIVANYDIKQALNDEHVLEVIYKPVLDYFSESRIYLMLEEHQTDHLEILKERPSFKTYLKASNKKGIPNVFNYENLNRLFGNKDSLSDISEHMYEEEYLLGALVFLQFYQQREFLKEERVRIIFQNNPTYEFVKSLLGEKYEACTVLEDAINASLFLLVQVHLNYLYIHSLDDDNRKRSFNYVKGIETHIGLVRGKSDIKQRFNKHNKDSSSEKNDILVDVQIVRMSGKRNKKHSNLSGLDYLFAGFKNTTDCETYLYRKLRCSDKFTLQSTRFLNSHSYQKNEAGETVNKLTLINFEVSYLLKDEWKELKQSIFYDTFKALYTLVTSYPKHFSMFKEGDEIETTFNKDDAYNYHYFQPKVGFLLKRFSDYVKENEKRKLHIDYLTTLKLKPLS